MPVGSSRSFCHSAWCLLVILAVTTGCSSSPEQGGGSTGKGPSGTAAKPAATAEKPSTAIAPTASTDPKSGPSAATPSIPAPATGEPTWNPDGNFIPPTPVKAEESAETPILVPSSPPAGTAVPSPTK